MASPNTQPGGEMARVVEADWATELGAMATMLHCVPREAGDLVDAVAVFPGLGDDARKVAGVRAWESSRTARHFFMAGTNDIEPTHISETPETLARFGLTRTEGVRTMPRADHTRHQSDWLLDQIEETGATSLALHVTPFHMLRAYCTVLGAADRRGVDPIPMIPMVVRVSPATMVPDAHKDNWDMFSGEAPRIAAYQEKGDVAKAGRLREYLGWLWEQSPVKDVA